MAWEGDGGGGCTTYSSCFPKPAPTPTPTHTNTPTKTPTKTPTTTPTVTPVTLPTTLPTRNPFLGPDLDFIPLPTQGAMLQHSTTATITPTSTLTTGQNAANALVNEVSTVVPGAIQGFNDNCVSPPGCGQALSDAFSSFPPPIAANAWKIGTGIDITIGTTYGLSNGGIKNLVTPASPQAYTNTVVIIGISIPTILIPIVITLIF